MNETRFNFLLRSLRFDDHTTWNARMKPDKLAPWRNTWECFLDNCQKNVPGNAITVDEQMDGFRGRCPFRYYMRNKPTKYGIKINMACDARNSYMLNGIVDLAKHRRPQVVPGKLEEYYTMTLTEPNVNSNRTITVDNCFTSLSLVKELYKMNTYLIGTSRMKGYVPKIMVDKKFSRPVDSSIFLFHEKVSMVLFKPKKNKIVLLLSSKHNFSAIGERNKPEAIHFYNKTKGGVDVLDMMCARTDVFSGSQDEQDA
ncbi:piggyBac transposable element-derived protein 4-like [Palaemon carinicauda]|uniref:piggyBac transposable element-derived protein 4-like n=1 Tax=Palaemon carinicauda TaxID=392227 RepID=UPI0035B647CB